MMAGTWCLRAGPTSTWAHHTTGEMLDARPAHHTLGANSQPSAFGSTPGLGALHLLPSSPGQSIGFGQKALPSSGWSAWQNNLLYLLWIQTWVLGFLFKRREPRLGFQNSIFPCFPVIPPKWRTEPWEQTLAVSNSKAPGASGSYFCAFSEDRAPSEDRCLLCSLVSHPPSHLTKTYFGGSRQKGCGPTAPQEEGGLTDRDVLSHPEQSRTHRRG